MKFADFADESLRMGLGRLDELVVHRLHLLKKLRANPLRGAAAFMNVAIEPTLITEVLRGVEENEIVKVPARLLRMENEDPVDDDDRRGPDRESLPFAGMSHEIVDRDVDLFAALELFEAFAQQREVDAARVIEVDGAPVVIKAGGLVDVEIVLRDDFAGFGAQSLLERASEISLAGATAAGDAEKERSLTSFDKDGPPRRRDPAPNSRVRSFRVRCSACKWSLPDESDGSVRWLDRWPGWTGSKCR